MNTFMRIVFDMQVLGAGIQTGVYRVCDELIPKLARRKDFISLATQNQNATEKKSQAYIKNKGLDMQWIQPYPSHPSRVADVFFTPFYSPWEPWKSDRGILKVVIAYDLIAIFHPDLFDAETSRAVRNIYDSLDRETLILAISESTKQDLLHHRPDIPEEQIVVIPLAAGEQFYPCSDLSKQKKIRAKYGIPQDIPYVLSLATLEIRKNMEAVVLGFAAFSEKNPEYPLCLVLSGMTGWKLDSFKKELSRHGNLKDRIILTGFVEDEDLATLYSGAQCFLYMSRYEGFGLPPLEAMACGTPVIASNTSSLPEVIGDAGYTLAPDDISGIRASLERILFSEEERLALKEKGIVRAELFNWERCADIVTDAIQKKLDQQIKLSIITICYNEKHIEDTCISIARQTWKNFEWIVVDGGSTDGTLDVLRKYQANINVLISEPDNGRYDAMNKGIFHAKGEYLLFLNGGDYLAGASVLERIFNYRPIHGQEQYTTLHFDADILYGQVEAKETGMMPWPIWTVGELTLDLDFFSRSSLPHQASFIKKRLFNEIGTYDVSLRSAADYEWFMRALIKHKATSQYIPMVVSVYNFEGISSTAGSGNHQVVQENTRIFTLYKDFYENNSKNKKEKNNDVQHKPLRKLYSMYQCLPEFIKKPIRYGYRLIKQNH